MARAGAVWVDVLPSLAGFQPALRAGLRTSGLGPMGESAGRDYGRSMSLGVRSGLTGMRATVKAEADAAAAAVREASTKVAAARDIEARAAGTVRVAELKLQEQRAAGGASSAALAAAEERLAASRRLEQSSASTVLTAESKLQALRDAGKATPAALAAAEKELSSAQRASADSSGRASVAEAKLQEIRNRGGASASSVAAAEERLATAARAEAVAAGKATVASDELAAAQRRAGEASATAGGRLGGLAATASGAGAKIRESMAGAGKAILGLGALGVGIGGAEFLVKGVEEAGKFQKAMNLLVTAGGESVGNLKTVTAGIKGIASDTGTSLDNLAEGMYTVEKASFRGANGLKVLRAAAEGAKDENVDLATMTNALTSVMRSYNLPASQSVRVMNELVAASGASKTSMANFAGALSTVMPIASAAHLSFAQVGGAIATLTSHGTSADEATQELSNTIRNLVAPNRVAVNEMAQFGIASNEVATQLGKKGLQGTLNDLSDTILSRMGPSGTVLLKAFNQSKVAAGDATQMYQTLAAMGDKTWSEVGKGMVNYGTMADSNIVTFQSFINGMKNGTISANDYSHAIASVDPVLKSQISQYNTTLNKARGFNQELRQGGNAAQTYNEAIKKMTGGATGLNTTLMLTGGSAAKFTDSINEITKAGDANGEHITAWALTQKTFNVILDRFRASVSVAAVDVGTALLPALTKIVEVLANDLPKAISAIQNNWGWIKPLAIGLTAVVAALVAGSVATAAWSAVSAVFVTRTVAQATATELAAGAQEGLNVALTANPIGIVVVTLAALSVAFYEAYKHSQTFRDIVKDVFDVLRDIVVKDIANIKLVIAGLVIAFQSVVDAAKWVSTASVTGFRGFMTAVAAVKTGAVTAFDAVVTAAKALGTAGAVAFKGFMTVIDAVGKEALWLYDKGILPPFHGIEVALGAVGAAAKTLWSTFISPYFTLIYNIDLWVLKAFQQSGILIHDVMVKVIGAGATWLWQNAINPAFTGIGKLAGIMRDAINVDGKAVQTEFTAIGTVATWLWKNAIQPAFQGVDKLALSLWHDVMTPVSAGVRAAMHVMGDASSWLSDTTGAAFRGITKVADNLWHSVFVPWATGVKSTMTAVGTAAASLWHDHIQPAFQGILSTIDAVWGKVKGVFEVMESAIQSALPKAFSAGVSGIQKAWSALQEAAKTPVSFVVNKIINPLVNGFDEIAKDVGSKAYIKPIPGFATGGPIRGAGGPTEDNIPIWASAGEFMVNAKSARKHHALLEAINGEKLPGFSIGGDIWNGIKKAAGSVWNAITDPTGLLKKFVSGAWGGLDAFKGNAFGQMVTSIPNTVLSMLADKVKSFIGLAPKGGGGGGNGAASPGTSAGQAQAYAKSQLARFGWDVSQMAPLIALWNQESSWNYRATNPTSGAYGIPQSLPASKMASAGADYLTNPATQINWGLDYIKGRYGSPAGAEAHELADHWYDSGGYMMPGRQLVTNGTGKPEAVFTDSQWQVLKSAVNQRAPVQYTAPDSSSGDSSDSAGDGGHHYTINVQKANFTITELEAMMKRLETKNRSARLVSR